jgi:hypothetical protein
MSFFLLLLNRLCLRSPMIGGPFPLLVEVAKLVEADLDRKISGRSFENEVAPR